VVNEATAAGLAVVCSAVVGAAAELVVDGVNGRLFTPGDLPQFTDRLRDVTAPGTIDRMKAASPGILADWRRRGDPVTGLRAALTAARILPVGTAGESAGSAR
jgi:glycosyltransferase involved in cell wall biosynthesis